MDLKTLQDWVLQRRFKRIPGVADVTGWGGKLRSYEVVVDNDRLVAHGATMPQVLAAIGKSDGNVGGQTVNFGPQAAIVRGIGLIQSTDQIGKVLVTTNAGNPVLLQDVSSLRIGNLPRLGIAGEGHDDDIVMGIVLMQRGAQSMPTIKLVKQEVDTINSTGVLPPGVQLVPIYDRSTLIGLTTHTVMHNLVEGVLLIFLLQWIFLGDLRSAIIVAVTIPFALAFAVLILTLQGESANLLSVGALDFGLVVDASVIMVENIYRHMVERSEHIGAGHGHFSHSQPLLGDPPRQPRGLARHLLRRRDHHRELPAAVHADRRRGPYLRPDGEDLCLCDRRRADRDLHHLADAGDAAAPRPDAARSRPGSCAGCAGSTSPPPPSRSPTGC